MTCPHLRALDPAPAASATGAALERGRCALIGDHVVIIPPTACALCRQESTHWPPASPADSAFVSGTIAIHAPRAAATDSSAPPPPAMIFRAQPPPEAPPLRWRLRTAWRALQEFVRSGGRRLDRAARARRLAICHACPERIDHPLFAECGRCGCILAAKSWLPAEHCPLGKWENGPPAARSGCRGCGPTQR